MTVVAKRGYTGGMTVDVFPETKQVVVGVGNYRDDMQFVALSAGETAVAAAALIEGGKIITQEDTNG